MLCGIAGYGANKVTVEIRNSWTTLRNEVVEMDASPILKKLNAGATSLRVRDNKGRELPSQLTYDGKLLVDVSVPARGMIRVTVEKGSPQPFGPWVFGRQYPSRKDDFAWENDKCIYRIYGPALQRSGEKSYGTDVWVKNTPELVVDQRYKAYTEGLERMRQMRKQGADEAEIKKVNNSINFHLDHGNGNDPYKVGPTLGCGAPALMDGGKLAFPWCYRDYKVLDNGPLRLTVQFDYAPKTVFGESAVAEHRVMSLDKGTHFCRQTVWYDGMSHPHQFATGVVVHEEDSASYRLGKDYVQYADPTDNPKRNKHTRVFVAVLFPHGITQTFFQAQKAKGGAVGHALGVKDDYRGEKTTYYFGSAWSGFDVKSQAEWQICIERQLKAVKEPMQITIL